MRRSKRGFSLLLAAALSFTAGVVVAATIFAYSSRIPIPLKITPTRGADDLLQQSGATIENDLDFPDRLRQREESAPPAEQPAQAAKPEPVKVTPAALQYYVQAGAFADSAAAEGLAAELGGLDTPVSVRKASDSAGSDLYRVVVGPFEKAGLAEKTRAQLALAGRTTSMLRLPAE